MPIGVDCLIFYFRKMEILTIIEIVGGVLAGGGLLEFFKWLATKNEAKRAAKLENDSKEAEMEDAKKDNIVDGWEKLAAQYQKDIEYYRTLIADRDSAIKDYEDRLLSKEDIIRELREENNNLSSENTALKLMRCEKLQCIDRVPPFGFKKLDIQRGLLVEDE